MAERLLGKDYVVLKNPGLVYNGATSHSDNFTHIGMSLSGGSLLCGGVLKEFSLSYRDVDVDCPKCIKKSLSTSVTDERSFSLAERFREESHDHH